MPKIAEIETTPNPNARKFVLREPLTWGISKSFSSPDEASADVLAGQLFAIPHVTNVFYVDHWITVTQDGTADWSQLLREVAKPIREAPAADAASETLVESTEIDQQDLSDEDRVKLQQVIDLLDERVRPYLQGDGGDLFVVGFDGKELKVHYQGACGGCPSSLSGTLSAIENMIRDIDPEMYVVPV